MSAPKVLVTGVSSPLGLAVCRSLRRYGSHITGSIRRARAGWSSPNVDELVFLDLEDPASFGVISGGLDTVIHVASGSEGTAAAYMGSCGLGTSHLLDRAERVGIRRIVHVSSMAVYGNVQSPTVSADTPIRHSTPFGAAKWAAECYLSERHRSVRATSVRSPAIVGARSHRHFLARALSAMQRSEPMIRVANPDFRSNNLVHEDSLAEFLVHLAFRRPDNYSAVPVGCTEPIPLAEVVEMIASRVGYRGRIEWVSSTTTPFSIDSAAATALGYAPLTMRATLERWMEDVATDA